MKQLTENLEGKALDWALAKALEARDVWVRDGAAFCRDGLEVCATIGNDVYEAFDHADPAVCLWLIKQYRMDIDQVERYPDVWIGAYFESTDGNESFQDSAGYVAETLEQAVARCVVQMRLGGEVDVPDELVGESK